MKQKPINVKNNSGSPHNLNWKLIKAIDKYEYVSFDVFDTLITRMVNKPSDIFNIVEKRYNDMHPERKIYGFLKDRTEAERKISKSVPTINCIYAEMRNKYSETTLTELMNIELEVEYEMCVPLLDMKEVYDYCLEKRKHIIAISDMYLNHEQLKRILDKCGYTHFDNIIISCETGYEKNTGNLFRELKGKNAVHIGDSWKADYLGAVKGMVKPIHISRYPRGNEMTNIRKISQYLNNGNYFENLGSSIIAPLLIAFSYWLDKELEQANISKVYFLSREGKIMKEVFDMMLGSKYETRDLYISRRVLTVACYCMLQIDSLGEMLDYFRIKKNSTVKDVIEYLELELDSVLAPYAGINIYKLIDNENIYSDLDDQLMKMSQREAILAKAYFEQELLKGSIAIVDIGWKGTMQKCLCQFIENTYKDPTTNIKGYYIALMQQNNDMYSFITDKFTAFSSIIDNPLLIENLLQWPEGSTIGYARDNGEIIPVKKPCEFDVNTKGYLRQIRQGVLRFVDYWRAYGYFQSLEFLISESINLIDYFICNPTKIDIEQFKRFVYSDIKEDYILPQSVKLCSIRSDFYSSAWKYGYIRQIIGINLNNQKIFRLLKRVEA